MYNYYQIKSFGGQIFLEILQGLILKMIRIYISIKFIGVMFYTLFSFKRKEVKWKTIINLFYFYFFTTCVNERAASKFRKERENKFIWNIAMVCKEFLGWWCAF